ncbi:sensor histidine kinase, partial [Singulisphaera rosea]
MTALRRIAEFLGIDRSGMGELVGNQLEITHSYKLPGVPPSLRVIVESHFPAYSRKILACEAFRTPDDLPREATIERAFLTRTGMKTNLTIPLKVTGSVVGAIGFAPSARPSHGRTTWSADSPWSGTFFTNALARKRADDALRTLAASLLTAQEEERRRVALEKHDDGSQRQAILVFDIADLEVHLGDSTTALRRLRLMQGRLVDVAEDLHALSRQVHPAILDDLGLAEALRSECAAFSRREGIDVAFRADAVPRLVPRDVALCVYRVAQEALRDLSKNAAVS